MLDEWANDAARGDREALEAVLRTVLPEVRRHARLYVGAEPDVDEVVEQVITTIARQVRCPRPDCSVRTWVQAITVRISAERLKQRKQVLRFERRLLPDREPLEASSASPGLLEVLDEVLTSLSAERRLVFVLAEVQGHTEAEIVGLLHLPVRDVRQALQAARKIVTAALSDLPRRRVG